MLLFHVNDWHLYLREGKMELDFSSANIIHWGKQKTHSSWPDIASLFHVTRRYMKIWLRFFFTAFPQLCWRFSFWFKALTFHFFTAFSECVKLLGLPVRTELIHDNVTKYCLFSGRMEMCGIQSARVMSHHSPWMIIFYPNQIFFNLSAIEVANRFHASNPNAYTQ